MSGTQIIDFLQQGLAAARPAAPDAQTDSISFYYATDTMVLSYYDWNAAVWNTLSAAGDVTGPGSATDNAITRFDGTTGKLIQNSGATIDDSGNLTANNMTGGANPTATASDTAVNGTATTFMRSDGAPAIQKASAAQFGVVEVDGTTITASSGVISAASQAGRLIGLQIFTSGSGATYTATSGTTSVIIELVGGGGGGSGVVAANAGTSQHSLGYPGQGGGYLQKRITSNFDGGTYTVGTGGGGGSAGSNAGTDGNDTVFTTTDPTAYTAKGGKGGAVGPGSFANAWMLPTTTTLNTTTGGDVNVSGQAGTLGLALSPGNGQVGTGGKSVYGLGGRGPSLAGSSSQSQSGVAGSGYGGAGSSGYAYNSGAAAAGAAGSDGIIIIWEYS